MLNKFSNLAGYLLIATLLASLGISIYTLQHNQATQVTTEAAEYRFANGWTIKYRLQQASAGYIVTGVDESNPNPQICAPPGNTGKRVGVWWWAKPGNQGREYFELVADKSGLGNWGPTTTCREFALATIRMQDSWKQACADGKIADLTLGIEIETTSWDGPTINLADLGCPENLPSTTPSVTPTPSAHACKKEDDIPLQDCQTPELEKQPQNVKLTYNNNFTYTVSWDAINNLPDGVTLQEYRLAIIDTTNNKAWIGYPEKVSVDKETTSYTTPELPSHLRGHTFYARVRAIYNDRLAEGDNCICRSNDTRSEETKASTGCENCVGQTVIRYPGEWDDNGDGQVNNCNEACKAYWGSACDGNNYCGNPGSRDHQSCCACQTSQGVSCNQLPTPTPPTIPTQPGPTSTPPPGGGPSPGYQPGVCKGEACYSPSPPQVKVYKDLNIGGVKFVFSEQGKPASKYTLRWATKENFDDPNHTKTECCGFSQCTGEQSCGAREACTGNASAEKSFHPVCNGQECVFERGGLTPCVEYKADIIAQVNTTTCPNKPQAPSNTLHFLYSDGSCDEREFGLEGSTPPPAPNTPATSPTAKPSPEQGYQPPGGGYKCSPIDTGEWCTVDKLMNFFSDDPKTGKTALDKAREAVMICNKENLTAKTNALNDRCLAPDDPLRTAPYDPNLPDTRQMFRDYSVGLFQINLLTDRSLFREVQVADNQPGYSKGKGQKGKYVCQAVDDAAVEKIRQRVRDLSNPITNINEMLAKSDNGQTWSAWNKAACECGLPGCNPSLLASEITGDSQVDAADVAVVMASYGSQQGQPEYNPIADFCSPDGNTADGVINAYEISCLIRDWNPR